MVPWPLYPRLAAKLALALLLQHSNTTSPQESCKRSSQAMPTYANLCPDTPIASIDIYIYIRYWHQIYTLCLKGLAVSAPLAVSSSWSVLQFNSLQHQDQTEEQTESCLEPIDDPSAFFCRYIYIYRSGFIPIFFTLRQHHWSAFAICTVERMPSLSSAAADLPAGGSKCKTLQDYWIEC